MADQLVCHEKILIHSDLNTKRGASESRSSHSKSSIVSFTSAVFSGYSRFDNVVKAQISFYGIQEANGFELLRMLRREVSLVSRPEALQYREACLKFTVKKADRHLLLDLLREVGCRSGELPFDVGGIFDFSTAHWSSNFRRWSVSFLSVESCLRKSKNMRSCTAAPPLWPGWWEAVNSYYVRMRMSGDLDKVYVAAQAKPAAAGSDVVCHNCGRKGHYARECPNPPKCTHCGKSGHVAKDCWTKDPSKKPSGAPKTAKPKATAKPAAAPKGKGKGGRGKVKGRGRGKLREVEEGEEPEKPGRVWRARSLSKREVEPKGQKAMVVKSATAVKTGSDAGGPKGATGTSSTERPVTHHLSSTLQEFVGSVGIGDPKTCWLVDSGATCHIVSEKWVKHYTVSFEYQGPRPSLKGAGNNDLPVKGVVDLEFMVGKTKVTMKRVVIVGIPLNVISTLCPVGNWLEDCFRKRWTKFPLKISDRAWWKVTLPKRKGGKSSGTVPMDLSTVSCRSGRSWAQPNAY